ncbi:MAG: hypothetical protein FD177_2222 [Desulfovibrionaceae bacterium]|nr:MAG: hypothetical protein FD177_2222 [Desulfovibrionaceae bacterium]
MNTSPGVCGVFEVIRAIKLCVLTIYSFIRHRLLVIKWAHHADNRSFGWDWKSINFNRIAVVNLLLSNYKNPKYLEIGCSTNILFDSVPTMNKIGVDPVAGGTERMTSDEFFFKNKTQFDVIFIDGLHTYAQARTDVVNAIKCLNRDGWIVLHDMLPQNWIEHHVPSVSNSAWTGDVWKVAFELLQTEGIEFKIVKIDFGVGVARVSKNNVELTDLTSKLASEEFNYYYDNIVSLPIVEWQEAQQWILS